jgi:uncharacterized protein (DUF1015 family)
MAVVRPFRAFRFDQHTPQAIERHVAPLWESLTPELLQDLYTRPDNAIHLSVPQSAEQALMCWNQWRHSGIVVRDPLPAFYPWFQRFSLFGSPQVFERRGFVALVKLNEPGAEPQLIVHEDILRPVVLERARLLEQLPLHVTPVHGLYYDPDFIIEKILKAYRDNPFAEHVDQQGVRHSLSIMQHPDDLHAVIHHLNERKIYLADGHHRLQSAELYRSQYLKVLKARNPLVDYVPMYLSNYAADDLRILPTHRLIDLPADFNVQDFVSRLHTHFLIGDFDRRQPLTDQLRGRNHCFGLLFRDCQLLVELKPDIPIDQLIDLPLPHSVKKLDYTLLHYLLIDRLLGIPYAEQNSDSRIGYYKDFATVHRAVHQEERNRLGILVNEVSMDELLAVCADGARMPQKSTYFFPKLLSGMLFASIDDDDYDTRFDFGF